MDNLLNDPSLEQGSEDVTPSLLKQPVKPVSAPNRIHYLDEVRGFALLGILVMNLQAFAMPMSAYFNPNVFLDFTGLNKATWIFTHFYAEMKMMTLFSMLFGAGMLLFIEKAKEKRGKSIGLHYRRMFWLLVLGLIHAFGIWWGDILVTYAICGLIVYWFKRLSPGWLLGIGILFFTLSSVGMIGTGLTFDSMPEETIAQMEHVWEPTKAQMEEELTAYKSGIAAQLEITKEHSFFNLGGLPLFIWRVLGNMLIGMALFKWGVLRGTRSKRFYKRFMWISFGIGLPLILAGLLYREQDGWTLNNSFLIGGQFNYWASILMSFGYLSLIALWSKSNFLPDLKRRLAAVGRMAFSNYIMHSVLGILIFYGIGLGLMGQMQRFPQLLIVFAIWALQLVVSPWWLKRYRFGPLEWLWRTLTYWKRQPMKRF